MNGVLDNKHSHNPNHVFIIEATMTTVRQP